MMDNDDFDGKGVLVFGGFIMVMTAIAINKTETIERALEVMQEFMLVALIFCVLAYCIVVTIGIMHAAHEERKRKPHSYWMAKSREDSWFTHAQKIIDREMKCPCKTCHDEAVRVMGTPRKRPVTKRCLSYCPYEASPGECTWIRSNDENPQRTNDRRKGERRGG